jgi:hypothetical protein
LNDRVTLAEEMSADFAKAKKKMDQECDVLRKGVQDVEMSIRKVESEKAGKDHQIRALQVSVHLPTSLMLNTPIGRDAKPRRQHSQNRQRTQTHGRGGA